jgi:DNA polymerase III subunit epsilon
LPSAFSILRAHIVPSPFLNSMFAQFIGANVAGTKSGVSYAQGVLGGVFGSQFPDTAKLSDIPIVVFDFETTGLSHKASRIIEIGAIRYENRRETKVLSQLVNPESTISEEITKITGLTQADVAGAPTIYEALPGFIDMLQGSLGVAHNAEFDYGMMVYESSRLGITCQFSVICTLKMARQLIQTERRDLDSLAALYGYEFESRHRSIGDIRMTANVLWKMLDDNPHIQTIKDLQSFLETPTILS